MHMHDIVPKLLKLQYDNNGSKNMSTHRYAIYIAALLLIATVQTGFAQTITTFAGTGKEGYSGDGGPATLAKMNLPMAIAIDKAGNVYIADERNGAIRMVDKAGTIHTIAGDGTFSYGGDGGPATKAYLSNVAGLAIDANDNIYIADESNNRIRKVDKKGRITTIAGSGKMGYSGNGHAATLAALYYPIGVAVDAAGNVYFADAGNHAVRCITTNGAINTIAGTGAAGYTGDGSAAAAARLHHPTGLAIDAAGDLYIADEKNNVIRKVSPARGGIITTIAGTGKAGYSGDNGSARNAQLNGPTGVATDNAGNIYIADYNNNRIRQINTTGIISTIAGTGSKGMGGDGGRAVNAQFYVPWNVTADAKGNLYIADFGNNKVRKVCYHCDEPTITPEVRYQPIQITPDIYKKKLVIKGSLHKTATPTDEPTLVEITDNGGWVIYKDTIIASKGFINTEIKMDAAMRRGMYILSLKGGDATGNYRFVVEN
jgi:hypothetical protein